MAFSRRSNEQIVGKFWILVMFEHLAFDLCFDLFLGKGRSV